MSEYQLYCMAESGNAYKAALALQLAGCDWEPIFVDFFGGEAPHGRIQKDQRNGRSTCIGAR